MEVLTVDLTVVLRVISTLSSRNTASVLAERATSVRYVYRDRRCVFISSSALEHAHKFLEELLYISTESIFLPFQWSLPG